MRHLSRVVCNTSRFLDTGDLPSFGCSLPEFCMRVTSAAGHGERKRRPVVRGRRRRVRVTAVAKGLKIPVAGGRHRQSAIRHAVESFEGAVVLESAKNRGVWFQLEANTELIDAGHDPLVMAGLYPERTPMLRLGLPDPPVFSALRRHDRPRSGASRVACVSLVYMPSPLPRRSDWVLVSLTSPAMSAFPKRVFRSACALSFSRIAQRSLTLRPAHSLDHPR